MLVVGVQPASAATGTPYTYTKMFAVADGDHQQALGYADGHQFIAFDKKTSGATDHIIEYTATGSVVKDAGALDLGHAAEMGYRQADGKFYVANGGTTDDAKVRVVDLRKTKPVVEDTYDFTSLGHDAMVAIDNTNDRMVVFAGPSRSSDVMALASFGAGTVMSMFKVPDLGTPNGLEVVGSTILYLSTLTSTQQSQARRCNTLTAFSFTGTRLYSLPIPVIGEGEGLAADETTGQLSFGLRPPGAVYKMSPAWTTPLGNNVLANGNAECNDAVTGNGSDVNVSGWSDSGTGKVNMTAIKYGANSGYPGSGSPGPSDRGTSFFSGGTSSRSTLTQSVDLSGFAGTIDGSSRLTYTLEGWLGGYSDQSDDARVVVSFRDSGGTLLGTNQIGPVTPADRSNVTGLLRNKAVGNVPDGTRSASVVITATRGGGTNNDGYSDNVSLTLNGS